MDPINHTQHLPFQELNLFLMLSTISLKNLDLKTPLKKETPKISKRKSMISFVPIEGVRSVVSVKMIFDIVKPLI